MFLLIIHIALCVVYVLLQRHRKDESGFPAVIVFMLPIFGFLMWLADVKIVAKALLGTKEIGLEKLKVTDTKYKRLDTDESASGHVMVPLEDALIVNDEKLRRSLLLDILHKNPEEYLSTLARAKASDDVEITHYATTTLLEIQSEYEQKLQDYLGEFTARRKDRIFLQEYADCLSRYVDSGLIDGSVLQMQQEKLLDVLGILLEMEAPSREDIFLYIETAMDLKRYPEAKRWLDDSQKSCEEMEMWNQLAVRYYWENGQTEEIDNVLRNVKKSNIYLSKEGKAWFQFWSKGKDYEEN